jgi:hypothetical protein
VHDLLFTAIKGSFQDVFAGLGRGISHRDFLSVLFC